MKPKRLCTVWRRTCSTVSTTSVFPRELWKTIRTTNILERAFREVRRRTRPMGVFTNAESAERIMCGVTKNLNGNWEEHPLRKIQQNC